MSANSCGSCKHYIEGKAIMGKLWKGSVCQCQTSKAFRLLRIAQDKPFDAECFEPIESVGCKCNPFIKIQERISR
jgi:hypothetical protein